MRSVRTRFLGCVVVAALACSSTSDDPFTADMKMICNAGRGHDELPPDMRRLEAFKEIAAKVKTAEAARLMAGLIEIAPDGKADYLRDAFTRAGIKRCAFLDGR